MQTQVDRPRFRQDLVAEPIEEEGGRFIDVMDPDSGQLFRFYEVEFSLACAMDGQRDVAGIVKWAEEELGLRPSANEVRTVIATLGELGYLERGADAAAAVTAAAGSAAAPEPSAQPTPARAKTPAAGTPTVPAQRKDQPAGDDHLARGVVAGTQRPATPAPDVELGEAGTRPPQAEELPRAPDLELGAPGASAAAKPERKAPIEDIALGAPGAASASGVSTDLSADMPVRPDDVKEAVRASQVMKAVDVPPELASELENKPAAKAEPQPAAKAEAKADAQAAAKAETKPVEQPADRPVAKAPPAPSTGTSPVLIALLVIAVLAAGGYLLYKYVIDKGATTTSSTAPVQPQQPEPPPAPPVEIAMLAIEQPEPEEIKSSEPATIATIVANDTAVKAGEPIARLVGYKPLEAELAALEKDVDKLAADVAKAEKDRDAAQTAGNKSGITAAEKRLAAAQKALAAKQDALATKQSALDKFLVKAPADGNVTAVAKANAKVTPNDIIATLRRAPVLVATFKSTGEVALDTKVLLALKDSEQKLSCTVVATGGDGTKIACPSDAASEGAEVTYAGIDPAAPAPVADSAEAGEPAEGDAGDVEPAISEETEDKADAPAPKATPKRRRTRTRRAPAEPAEPQVDTPQTADEPAGTPEDKPADTPTPAGSSEPQ